MEIGRRKVINGGAVHPSTGFLRSLSARAKIGGKEVACVVCRIRQLEPVLVVSASNFFHASQKGALFLQNIYTATIKSIPNRIGEKKNGRPITIWTSEVILKKQWLNPA